MVAPQSSGQQQRQRPLPRRPLAEAMTRMPAGDQRHARRGRSSSAPRPPPARRERPPMAAPRRGPPGRPGSDRPGGRRGTRSSSSRCGSRPRPAATARPPPLAGRTKNRNGRQIAEPVRLTTARRRNGSPPCLTRAFQAACSTAAPSTTRRREGSRRRPSSRLSPNRHRAGTLAARATLRTCSGRPRQPIFVRPTLLHAVEQDQDLEPFAASRQHHQPLGLGVAQLAERRELREPAVVAPMP